MKIKELRSRLKGNGLFGGKATYVDPERDVIVQVYEGEHDMGDGWTVPKYRYYDVRAVGMLFHDGEFKQVIAVGKDDEAP